MEAPFGVRTPGIAAVSSAGLPECRAGELRARALDRLLLRARIGLEVQNEAESEMWGVRS